MNRNGALNPQTSRIAMENQEFDEQVDRLKRYRDSLLRHAEDENHPKIQYYIEKLRKLPIKVDHLQATRIGEIVNQLRGRFDGETKDLAKKCVNEWKEMVNREQKREEELEEKAKAEAAKKKKSMKEEQERISREGRNENAVPNHSKHHGEASSSHQRDAESKHKSHKRSHSSGDDHHSKKQKKDHHDKDKHHKSHDHHSKHNEQKNKHRSEDEDKHKSKSKESKDRHKEDAKEREREQVKDREREQAKEREREQAKEREREQAKEREREQVKEQERQQAKELEREKAKERERQQEKERAKDRNKDKEHSKKDKSSDKSHRKESGKDKKSSSGSSKSKSVINVVNGIDSGSGASFAEALGMCEPTSSKSATPKKETTKKKSSSSPEKKSRSEKEKPSGSSAGHSSSKHSSHSKLNPRPDPSPSPPDPTDSLPALLKEPAAALDPVDLNISSLLPTITPNYRPVGTLTMSDVASKRLSDYEALSNSITSKNQRTKVYSGNKAAIGKVTSLFDMCIRILQDNIDSLEFTGGVPFHILKPILDKATPNQLYLLEHHNPYLIEDTDDLWRLHCQKEFRNKQRLELESWREMYMRCLDEREAKLIALTANIKQAQDKSVPVRKAKLAFVDDIAKPPRNVARQQAKNGTGRQFDKRPLVTPSSRLSTLTTLATSGEAGKVSVPNPGARAAERSSASNKPAKKAPLMAKSLSLLKNRFKR